MEIKIKDDIVHIKLTDTDSMFTYAGHWDILKLKNAFLKNMEKSFEKEIIDLLKAGTFSKYRDM